MPGVWLTALRTDKFKTDLLSITLLSQLLRETAAQNAAIPSVLRRGTTFLPDMDSIAAELDALYGASITPVVRRIGEVHATGFAVSFAGKITCRKRKAAPHDRRPRRGYAALPQYPRRALPADLMLDSEKQKLLEKIQGQINEKIPTPVQRLIEICAPARTFPSSAWATRTLPAPSTIKS
jgi:hypothetical protein